MPLKEATTVDVLTVIPKEDGKRMATNLKSLMTQLDRVNEQIQIARAAEVAQVVRKIHALMEQYDLTADELGFCSRSRKPAKKSSLPARYVDPQTGKTWSGKGRKPFWITGDASKYLIK